MKKFFNFIEWLKKNYIRLIVSFGFVVAFFFSYLIFKNEWNIFHHYVDAVFIGGAIIFLVGGLSCVSYFGQFDIFSFMFNTKRINGEKETLYDYSERKKGERAKSYLPFLSYFIVGTFTLLISLILFLIYKYKIL